MGLFYFFVAIACCFIHMSTGAASDSGIGITSRPLLQFTHVKVLGLIWQHPAVDTSNTYC
jgi:hypothetical protein